MEILEHNKGFVKNNIMATSHCLDDHNHMEMGDRRTLAMPYCIGDLLLMATIKTTGNISSSVQHSRDEVMPSHSCLLTNKFLA